MRLPSFGVPKHEEVGRGRARAVFDQVPGEPLFFAGADGAFTLREDEGTDMGYSRGQFSRVPMRWYDASKVLALGERDGSFPGMEEWREISVIVHDGSERGPVFDREPTAGFLYHGEPIP